MGFRIFVILMGIRTHGRKPGANEGSASTVWSAEGKRPEFVGAKRAQAPLQGACATIERTGLRIPPGVRKIRQEQQNVENLADFSFLVLISFFYD